MDQPSLNGVPPLNNVQVSVSCPLLSAIPVKTVMQELIVRAGAVSAIATQRLARLALSVGHHQLVYDIQDLEEWVQVLQAAHLCTSVF